jgi:hypothetical protein
MPLWMALSLGLLCLRARAVCVWLVWRWVKSERVCCCLVDWFVDEIWRGAFSSVRIPLVCARGVPNGGLVWNLCVNDTTILLALKANAKTQHQNIWLAIPTFQHKRIQPGAPPIYEFSISVPAFFTCQFLTSTKFYIYKALTSKIPLTRSRWTPLIYATSKKTLSHVYVFFFLLLAVKQLITWRWPNMAETCSHRQTNKSRSYDSCVLMDPSTLICTISSYNYTVNNYVERSSCHNLLPWHVTVGSHPDDGGSWFLQNVHIFLHFLESSTLL